MGTLYENINVLCLKKNVTGSKMCTDIGISRNFMTELKYGRKADASGETIKKIADYFGVSADEVLNGKKETAQPEGQTAESEYDKFWRSLTEDQKRAFYEFMHPQK